MNGGNRNIATHNTRCPICTSILTKPDRVRSLKQHLPELMKAEQERNRLYLILFGILRQHGGQIVLHNPPDAEEIEGKSIDYNIDNDGALHITLAGDVLVESRSLLIAKV